MKYLAFDIEIAKDIPEGETNWQRHRPFGITCAATFASDESEPFLHYSMHNNRYSPQMEHQDLCDLVGYLKHMARTGYTILTWNGLAFDFDVLAEESGMSATCVKLALHHHVDMMYHIFCLRGHYVGLDRVAKGLGLAGKPEGMTGAKAPQMWANGQQRQVLDYVSQDVRTTLQVAQEVERLGMVQWTSASGRLNMIDIDRWLPVCEAQQLPLPDTSWMSNPPSRDQFIAWMRHEALPQ